MQVILIESYSVKLAEGLFTGFWYEDGCVDCDGREFSLIEGLTRHNGSTDTDLVCNRVVHECDVTSSCRTRKHLTKSAWLKDADSES